MKKFVSFALFILSVLTFVPTNVFAQGAAAGGGGLMTFLPIILIFVFFWFFLLRPQQKKAKEHQKMLNALKKGDEVVAVGGIFATVVSVKDNNVVEIKIAEGVNILVSKPAISAVIVKPEANGSADDVKMPEIIKK
ncbi:MAG: preprotein translocase subunit YajC [Elusimicrobiota bacterium]|jgi:preprotein translocase subunit YajC|nr:preprotein translocase subunit YajC [Elusimicrobiota bacterium]